jgi:hypothetical protein
VRIDIGTVPRFIIISVKIPGAAKCCVVSIEYKEEEKE